jgi:hypothetical protein
MLTMFVFLLFSAVALTIVTQTAHAQDLSASTSIWVDHLVKAYDGGLVTINDTITLAKKTDEQPPVLNDFQLGFPYEYKFKLYHVSAYDSQTPQQELTIDLDTGLGVAGFYGVTVHFKNEVNLNSVASFSFTVVYEFSDLVTERIEGVFLLDFPVYPSLNLEATSCSTTVVLPPNVELTNSSPTFNQTASDTFVLEKKPLAPYTIENGVIRFEPGGTFNILDIEVTRKMVLNEWNELFVSDLYAATNKASTSTSTMWALLPTDAFDISAKDDVGNTLTFTPETLGELQKVTITLKYSIPQNQTAFLLVSYKLPWKNHVTRSSLSDYVLNFKLFEPLNMTVNKVTATVELPEGASFQPSTNIIQYDMVQNGIFNQAVVFTQSNISSYQDTNFTVKYSYSVFWSSFRPTLWVGAFVTIVGAVAFLWQTRRAAPTTVTVPTTLRIHPEELRKYVKTHEEQSKLQRERESLEGQARKGKIPRRLYKVRSQTLESRLSLLSRDLAALSEKIRSAGPRYSDMMRQIEVAQAELQGVEADITRTETRYKRGEISAVAYHKLLEDYLKRKDRAQTNIDGILLRLREESG